MSEKVSRNAEGYPDPTFGGAWGNMHREEKQREASGAWREPERSSS